MKSLKCTN